ncbi:hypothetical protein PanWU01x14_303250 [Parasponia andersonii]|uniref:Uncharacterized protein n=1 Tax=Parasponia andersonii TaxID=3476 RepID=A0A2P5AT20_PARAD|nr:hypothetical protein PanWU01x14_303250 [Parasponia andersonii]
MSDLLSRNARIYNECREPIVLKVLHYPGALPDKEIPIPPGGYEDISYQTVDNSYNRDRWKEISIERQGKEQPGEERITSRYIRDCEKLILTLIDNDDEENRRRVHVRRIEGNFFLRIGIVRMLRDFGRNLKKSVRRSTPMDANVTIIN